MSYTIRHDADKNIIYIEVETAVDAAMARSMCVEGSRLAGTHNCRSVMVIFREPVIAEGTMAIYNFARSMRDLGVDPSIRLAHVLPRQDPDHRFFETVAKNLGYEVRYFTDADSAEHWLSRGRTSSGGGGQRREKTAH